MADEEYARMVDVKRRVCEQMDRGHPLFEQWEREDRAFYRRQFPFIIVAIAGNCVAVAVLAVWLIIRR